MAQELQDIKSIFDFFYLDNLKIKSFYAQLTGNGALSSLKNTNSISDARQFEAMAGIPLTASGKGGTNHSATIGAEHHYDATPTLPREMINKLDELGFIHRELIPENLGNLVLLSGFLSVIDIEAMKGLIDPAAKFMVSDEPSNSRNKTLQSMQPLVDFIKQVPFALSCTLFVNPENDGLIEVWMSLSREDMPSGIHDINFKHGENLAGEWYVLGILDAVPACHALNQTPLPGQGEMEQFKKALSGLMKMFGRSDSAYGMTPIAIFRVLKPK